MSVWERVGGAAKLVVGGTGAVVSGVFTYGTGATAEGLTRAIGASGVGERIVKAVRPTPWNPARGMPSRGGTS